jgi:hypothetical protein
VEAKNAMPYVTFLSVPISVIFWILYFTEDRLIGQISAYNRRLFTKCGALSEEQKNVQCWDGSPEAVDYLKIRDLSRFFVHLIVFLIIPVLLLYRYYFNLSHMGKSVDFAFVMEVIGLLIILLLILSDFKYRKRKRKNMMAEQIGALDKKTQQPSRR